MTRADINFIHKDGILYHYHNGDQYPDGIRDCYNLLDWISKKDDFNVKGFTKWLADNYVEVKRMRVSNGETSMEYNEDTDTPVKPTNKKFVTIDKFTDYGYVFDSTNDRVTVYSWGKSIFEGTRPEFVKWLTEYKD